MVTTTQTTELNDLYTPSDGPLSANLPYALPLYSTAGVHERAAGWVRREHRGAVSGINYSLCSQENADGLSTAGECLASGRKRGQGLWRW